jgi:hypothetical protein
MAIYDVFGLSWNSGASLGTKQGYITTLLNNGITPEQIKAKIAELDPSGATEANFKLLGIPEPAPTPPAANQRVEDLANQLGIPKFVIASLVNQGMSDDDIRAKYTSTPEIAEKLIEASMSTGVADTAPTNFNQYGGYDKVLNEYLESGQNLSLASLSPTQLNEAAAKVSTTGSGNLNTLALTGTPITQTALDNMAKNGVDANTIASIKETYSPENIKATQTKALQDLVTTTPNLAETDLFSKYAELAKGYQGTYEGGKGVDFKGASGLREFYGPYVTDYLSRMSGLLAERDSPQYQATKFGTTYGTDTANTLKALQTERQNMMGMGTGAGATPMYTPSKFSFASPNASLTAQGIKSLSQGSAQDKINFYKDYMQGADQALRNAATTYMGPQSQSDWDYLQSQGLAGFSQGGVASLTDDSYADGGFTGQTVPSTFDAPTAFSPTTVTSGYTAPTNMYTAGNISSGYTAPTTYQAPTTGITTGTFGTAQRDAYMSPYMSGVVDPAVREAKRQSEIAGMANAAKYAQAGAFGGTRNVLADVERQRNLATQIGDIYGKGQQEAFLNAQQFERDQARSLQAQTATEAARQAAGQQALSSAATAGQLGLQAQTAQEQARQAAGQQALTSAQTAAQLGLDASRLTEQSKQFGAQYGLQTAQTAAQYDQAARQLQQQAEEAQARGDQFGASLALQQLQEAQRAAETTRAFEYQQARDTYLDPYREIMYANQVLGGLPISAAATGISPNLEALVAALGLGTALKSV